MTSITIRNLDESIKEAIRGQVKFPRGEKQSNSHCCRRTSQAAARLLAQAIDPIAVERSPPEQQFPSKRYRAEI
jgi:hypothetical protein